MEPPVEMGMAETLRRAMETSATGIEALAVLIILTAVVHGTVRYILRAREQTHAPYEQYRVGLAKALLLGLEFLVAADIVRTVALTPTLQSVAMLAVLVVVRTFLSWSLTVEIEGRWPWRGAEAAVAPEQDLVSR